MPSLMQWMVLRGNRAGQGGGAPAQAVPPELLTLLPNGGAYNRRAQPRSYALPDGTEVVIGDLAAVARQQDLLLNPFGARSAHHRPIGRGAVKGIPGTTGPATRGRLDVVGRIRIPNAADLGKWYYRALDGDDPRSITSSGSGIGLPSNEKMPAGVFYPDSSDGDCIVIRPAPSVTADAWYQFRDAASTASIRRTYTVDGDDLPWTDGQDRGNSASKLRFPAACLFADQLNLANPPPQRYALHLTATRHDGQGANSSIHVLGKTWVAPALGTDGDAGDEDRNLGNIPYGTRIWLPWDAPWQDLRELSGFNQRQKVYFDIWRLYGAYILDGQGQHEEGKAILQLRQTGGLTTEVIAELEAVHAVILPYLWPMRNAPASFTDASETWADGLPYAGGDGPLGPESINSAWDAR
jgi:hypothetical protein